MKSSSYIKTAIFALFSFFLVLLIIAFPKEAYESSLRGLTIWWDVVFPALLPFFITAELLIGFGVVHFIGVLLEPLMRPIFRVPGVGGFVFSMGLASGYPMGAKLTVRLREQELITKSEGERLLSMTSTSGPLFMFGAVAVGFFHDVTLGIIIAGSHYIAAFGVGLVMRFHRYQGKVSRDMNMSNRRNILYRALQEMHRARINDGRTIGTLMGDAVMSSIQTLMLIGGFIIIFSVLINIMNIIGISTILSNLFTILLILLGLNPELSTPLYAGIFEITLGSKWASELTSSVPLVHKVAMTSAIIAWSGLSVHAQVASMIARTDLSYKPYLVARVIHAIFAAFMTYVLWTPFETLINRFHVPTIVSPVQNGDIQHWSSYTFCVYALMIISIMLFFLSCIHSIVKRVVQRRLLS